MTKLAKTLKKKKELEGELRKAEEEIKTIRANMKFKCACGKFHAIKDCTIYEIEFYQPPFGCTGGGDYQKSNSEFFIECVHQPFQLVFGRPNEESWVYIYANRIIFYSHPKEQLSRASFFTRVYVPLFKTRKCISSSDRGSRISLATGIGHGKETFRVRMQSTNNHYFQNDRFYKD